MLAIFVSLISTASALPGSNTVKKGDIAPGAVTARTIAPGAVRSVAIRDKAVTNAKLASGAIDGAKLTAGSVGNAALAKNAVTDVKLAPASVGAAQLKSEHVVTSPSYTDPDTTADTFTWTSSGYTGHTASCPQGERLLSGGVATGGGNDRGFLQSSLPLGPDVQAWAGGISSDAGGSSPYHVYAVCLLP